MLPQVEEVLKQFPLIKAGTVNAEELPAASGHLLAFTAPVLLLYVDGKEMLREARFVPIETFQKKVKLIYEGASGSF